MMKLVVVFIAGVIFAAGLVISGMTDPKKVQAFLDVGGISNGRWDASLAFVMAGAMLTAAFAFYVQPKRGKPWFAATFNLPAKLAVDRPLVAGAALFGVGWGLSGYCPGPAVASLLWGGTDALGFIIAMLAGMWGAKRWQRLSAR